MRRPDMTVKTLLCIIALCLGIIALRPFWEGSAAQAQIGNSTSNSTSNSSTPATVLQTELINRIVFNSKIEGVQVMPANNLFLVYTAGSVEVYRVATVASN